ADVGLAFLSLGQPLTTLSAASMPAAGRRVGSAPAGGELRVSPGGSGEYREEEDLGQVGIAVGPLDQLLPPRGCVARDGGSQSARQRLEAHCSAPSFDLPQLVVPAVTGVLDEVRAGIRAVVVHAQALVAVDVDELVCAEAACGEERPFLVRVAVD